MDVAPIQRRLEASDIPPERLAANSQLSEEQKIAEAARLFEAILLRQILESTQKPVICSAFTDDSTAAGIYRDMVTSQLADSISKSGTLGLGKSLEKQFQRPTPSLSAGHGHPTTALSDAPAITTDAVRPPFDSSHRREEVEAGGRPIHPPPHVGSYPGDGLSGLNGISLL